MNRPRSGTASEREPIVKYSRKSNRVSWVSTDTEMSVDTDDEYLAQQQQNHENVKFVPNKPYSASSVECCNSKRSRRRTALFLIIPIFIITVVGLVYIYYSKVHASSDKSKTEKSPLPVVKTECGPVEGESVSTEKPKCETYVFKGIPYAKPPMENLRWKAPKGLKGSGSCWNGTYSARKYGSPCVQPDFETNTTKGSEDCLYLNIWTPTLNKDAKLPVAVWIHGGFLTHGWGNMWGYCPNPEFVCSMNIVAVSMNYRLNAFGFMTLDILSQASVTNSSGNYGFMDQILALKWVQNNILNFGGDPSQVTIFGQSSGGTSIFALLVSPLAKGLFQRAISMSGSAIYNKSFHDASKDNYVFIKKANCDKDSSQQILSCLYNLTQEEVINAIPWYEFPYWAMADQNDLPTKGLFDGAVAVVDHVVVPIPPSMLYTISKTTKNPVSVLVGTMAQEIGNAPVKHFLNSTWKDFAAYVKKKLGKFSPLIASQSLNLYPNKTTEGMTRSPDYLYQSMASDLRVSCPNNILTKNFSHSKGHVIYRYVVTNIPTKPVIWHGYPLAYAFHTWDSFALFGYKTKPSVFIPASKDIDFMNEIRKQFLHFFKYGHLDNPKWFPYPSCTGDFSNDGLKTLGLKGYNFQQCEFWTKNGFFSYGWDN